MNNLWTVVRFTFMSTFRQKSFKVMTIILALLITIGINLPTIIDKLSSKEPDNIGIINTQPAYTEKLAQFYAAQPEPKVKIVPLADSGSQAGNDTLGRDKIKAGEIKGYVEFTGEIVGGFPKVVYKSDSTTMENSVRGELLSGLQALKTDLILKDISKDQLAIIQAPVSIESMQVKTSEDSAGHGRTENEMTAAFILVYAMLFLLYMSVIMYGNTIAMSVTQEKSSRVMELLITSSKPIYQMFGKIIGTCLIALFQLFVFILVAALNMKLPSNQTMLTDMHLSLSDIPLDLIAYFLVFYLGGFFLYAVIAAGIGSIISRVEDVGQAIMPVMFLVMFGFFVAMYGLQSPNSSLVVVMSYIPFFAPLIMFLRIGIGDPAIWEAGVSIVILIASIILLGWLAAKIYRTGVLLYGKRPSVKELRKAMRAYKA